MGRTIKTRNLKMYLAKRSYRQSYIQEILTKVKKYKVFEDDHCNVTLEKRWYTFTEKSPLELHICRCGRLHFYMQEDLDMALTADQRLVLICSKCGEVHSIWANKGPDFWSLNSDDSVYNIAATEVENEVITQFSFVEKKNMDKIPIRKIIISEGKGVFMKTGRSANYFEGGRFRDYDSNFEIMKNYETLDQLKLDMDKYDDDRRNISYIDRLTTDEYHALKDYKSLFPKEVFDNILSRLLP